MAKFLSFFTFLLIFLNIHTFYAQQQNPHFEHFLTKDGLPSREVYSCFQDKDGFMWFGTDNGIAKFDGYEFIQYQISKNSEDNVINVILEDHFGKLWFSSMFGGVYYYDNDQLVSFEHNGIFTQYQGTYMHCTLEYISTTGTFYFGLYDLGILEIKKNGESKLHRPKNTNYIFLEVENKVISTRCMPLTNDFLEYTTDKIQITYIHEPLADVNINLKIRKAGNERFYKADLSKTKNIYFYLDKLCYLRDGKVYQTQIRDRINAISTFENGNIHLHFNDHWGMALATESSIQQNTWNHSILKDQNIASSFIDNKGGLWVTTLNNGVFYARSPHVKIWNVSKSNYGDVVSALAPINENDCFFGAGISKIYQLKENVVRSIETFPIPASYCFDMEYCNDKLYAFGGYYAKDKWHFVYQKDNTNYSYPFKQIFHEKDSSKLWLTNYRGFAAMKLNNDQLILQNSKAVYDFTRIYNIVQSKRQNTWLATQEGLQLFKNNKNIAINNLDPRLKSRINLMAIYNNDKIILASKTNGLLLFNENDYSVEVIDSNLSNNYVRNIYVDDFKNIWISSNGGLTKISELDNGKFTFRNFGIFHGLPSEDIYQCERYGNSIWIASAGGLIKFKEPEIELHSPKPNIINIKSNSQNMNVSDSLVFEYETNLTITYRTTNYKLLDKISYRLRSNFDTLWRYTQATQMDLTNLQSGSYRYEIQSSNEDDIWSDSTIVSFKVHLPWWKTKLFYGWSILLIAFFAFAFHKIRTKNIRNASDLQTKINKLEKMALLSQMNPHFISNAFASLQYFITTNDLNKAEDYLSDLSGLIRRILENSRTAEATLSQEVELLRLYLHLENQRYNHKFSTIMEIDPNIDLNNTFIPPMILQPLVENAILHGLRPLDGRKGILTIQFQQVDDKLQIKIDDNGIGRIKAQQLNKEKIHKSYALDIIIERIQNLNRTQKESASIQFVDKDQISQFGTLVIINFNIN